MTDCITLLNPWATWTLLVLTPLTVLLLRFVTAPYGRHHEGRGWGPTLDPRWGWVLMESPALWGFGWWFLASTGEPGVGGWILLALWMLHYVERTLVYPLRLRVRPGDRMPLLVAAAAFFFQVVNTMANGPVAGGVLGTYDAAWLTDPRFLVGTGLFLGGLAVNRWADHVLRNLRKPGETGYRVPRGGLYEVVSCPNYLGEIVQWWGWALATWSLAGVGFALYTMANLVPRAVDHHRWYREKFADYPEGRRAVFPGLL